jgi:hypothetical protein
VSSSIAETSLWWELSDGIDPARWARLCRHLDNLTPEQFKKVEKRLWPDDADPLIGHWGIFRRISPHF